MKILFFFSGHWYTQEEGQDPVSLHPNNLRETFQSEENTKKEADGYFWDVSISGDGQKLSFYRRTLVDS